MAITIPLTAGIFTSEIDISQYTVSQNATIAGVVGLAPKGQKDTPLLFTSLQQLIQTLGTPSIDYPALLFAREFFNAGGGLLFFVRVGNGDTAATVSIPELTGSGHLVVNSLTTGNWYNNISIQVSYSDQLNQLLTQSHAFTTGANTVTLTLANAPLVPGTVQLKFGSTVVANDDGNGVLVFTTANPLYTGTVNYVTGVVVVSTTALVTGVTNVMNLSTSYWSTFGIQVVQAVLNQAGTRVNELVLESYAQLTISTVTTRVGTAVKPISKYITVTANPADFPMAGNYPMTGGLDGSANVTDADFVGSVAGQTPTGLQNYAFPDQITMNVVAVPGVSSQAVREAVVEICETNRNDTIGLLDPPQGLDIQGVSDWANAENDYSTWNVVDTNKCAIYYPEYTSFNNITNDYETTPPSCAAIQAFVRSKPWEAPAGMTRGMITNLTAIAQMLNPAARSYLDSNRINSISNLNSLGEMILGQRTATLEASSLDRVGARRMMFVIETAIAKALYPLLFEPDTDVTWNRATMIVQPYLDSLKAKEQIYDGQFLCDATTNTTEIINNNQMACIVQIQPLKYAEIITVAFIIESVGAQITEAVASVLAA